MGLLLSDLVLTPLNKMVVQNENIVTFLMLFAPFSFLPLFLSASGVKPHSLLCTPLIVFLHQPFKTNHHLSFSMVNPLTTHLFGFLVVFALSLFLLMNAPSSSLVLVYVVFLVMACLKRGFAAMIPFLIVFVCLVMLSFGNIVLSRVFNSFLRPLPPSLPFLLIFLFLSILNLWRILRHRLPLQTTHLRLSPRHLICLSWILWHHPLLSLLLILNSVVPLG
ncbi:hypothetical protein ACOSQ2_001111 [Xanthoceras sorbifolium]